MTSPFAPPGYRIRRRCVGDDGALLGVENRAAALFRDYGFPDLADNPFPDVETMRRLFDGNDVWVGIAGDDVPVGYAVAGPLDGFLHLHELSIDPSHGRRGLGTALVETVAETARKAGVAGISLSTFRFVPFNRPFYERLGFSERSLDEASPALRDAFLHELPQGVDMKDRLLMVRRTDGGNES